MIRFLSLRGDFPLYLKRFLIILRLRGGAFVRFLCLNHLDIKSLVAYSSVVHISTCIRSILIISDLGYKGALIIIIAHGLTSSGLFFLISFIYERRGSRRLLINKGLLNIIPSITFM